MQAFRDQKKGYNYTNKILRPFIPILLPYVLILMNTIFFATTEVVWAPSMLFKIAKKGILKLAKNWRGIQMGEYVNAWYDRIMGNRIKLWMNVDEFQTAYQKLKSCNTQLFTFRTISELAKKVKKPIFISYVDLEKAFDKVNRNTMFRVLANLGIGSRMLEALKNLYRTTKVFFDGSEFVSTAGIRQGASSSVYLFIVFINGLFKHLRNMFANSVIFGPIHSLIHADDTLVIDDVNVDSLKSKVVATYEFFGTIDQSVNVGKSKYMRLDSSTKNSNPGPININGQLVKYTPKEQYLGHYITDDNSLNNAILCDLAERESNVIVKFRNFVNNNKSASMGDRLMVFQACFCGVILSNCEAWGHCFPKKILSLYNRGLKMALEVRVGTPTALIFLETKQPAVLAMIRKRQLNFWQTLQKEEGRELCNLISRAKDTKYIKHYIQLEETYGDPQSAFELTNNEFYRNTMDTLLNCRTEQTKLCIYKEIYHLTNEIPTTTFTLAETNENRRKLLSRYVLSSHNLACVTSKWSGGNRACKNCDINQDETLKHFLFDCSAYTTIRSSYPGFPRTLQSFFEWESCGEALEKLHVARGDK